MWTISSVLCCCFLFLFVQFTVAQKQYQFQMVNAPTMCAAGKSSWVDATGASSLHLELCKMPRGRKNPNTLFTFRNSLVQPGMKVLVRQNSKKVNFCLHNFGADSNTFASLSFINPCSSNSPEEQWNLLANNQVSWTQDALGCWDTLGAYFIKARIGLQPCDSLSNSQKFRQI